jgi:pilus assembly protein Flp/PilA
MNSLQRFIEDEEGVSAIEYAVLAVIVVVAVSAIGTTMNGMFTDVFNAVKTKVTGVLSAL